MVQRLPRSAAVTSALWWFAGSVLTAGAYVSITGGGVSAGHREVAYPAGIFATFALFQFLLHGFTVQKRAVSLPKLLLPWAVLVLAFTAYRVNFWISSGEREPGVPFVIGNRTVPAPPDILVPDSTVCVSLEPTKHCPNRRHYGYANPQVFGNSSGQSLAEVDAAFEAIVAVADLAADLAHKYELYSGTVEDKKECRDTTIQALCELAFPRCTATCVRTQPCLSKPETALKIGALLRQHQMFDAKREHFIIISGGQII